MILSTLVTPQLHFEMCAGLYGHPVFLFALHIRYINRTYIRVARGHGPSTFSEDLVTLCFKRQYLKHNQTF